MTTKNYTPGTYQVSSRVSTRIETTEGRTVATTGAFGSTVDMEAVCRENDANAVLFAAAPELVEALIAEVKLRGTIHLWDQGTHTVEQARSHMEDHWPDFAEPDTRKALTKAGVLTESAKR